MLKARIIRYLKIKLGNPWLIVVIVTISSTLISILTEIVTLMAVHETEEIWVIMPFIGPMGAFYGAFVGALIGFYGHD